MPHPKTVNIHIRDGAIPAAFTDGGWLDLDTPAGATGPVLFLPDDPCQAVAYLDALSRAATELRNAIAELDTEPDSTGPAD